MYNNNGYMNSGLKAPLITGSILLGIGLIILMMAGMPRYNVWRQEMSGKAQLAEAEWSKKIQIEEAMANLESEKLNALSEVERAKGMAESITIESGKLTPQYIQYLWVRNSNFDEATKIYIPTEANLPILEAK